MQIKTYEGKFGLSIDLTPEDMKEVCQLLRSVKNVSREPPGISLNFDGETPYLSIYFNKVKESVQTSSIKSGRK